jgi:hypothetical protein
MSIKIPVALTVYTLCGFMYDLTRSVFLVDYIGMERWNDGDWCVTTSEAPPCHRDSWVMYIILSSQIAIDAGCLVAYFVSFKLIANGKPWDDGAFLFITSFAADLGMWSSIVISPFLILMGIILVVMGVFCLKEIKGWRITKGRYITTLAFTGKEASKILSGKQALALALIIIYSSLMKWVALPAFIITEMLHVRKSEYSEPTFIFMLIAGSMQVTRHWYSVREVLKPLPEVTPIPEGRIAPSPPKIVNKDEIAKLLGDDVELTENEYSILATPPKGRVSVNPAMPGIPIMIIWEKGKSQELITDEYGEIEITDVPLGKFEYSVKTVGLANEVTLKEGTGEMLPDKIMIDGGPPIISPMATRTDIQFDSSGEPISNGEVGGTYIDPDGGEHKVSTMTGEDGQAFLLLPVSNIKDGMAQVGRLVASATLGDSKTESMPIPLQPRFDPRINQETILESRPKFIHCDRGGSFDRFVLYTLDNQSGDQSKIVVLGDVSGSMSSGDRMPQLRSSYIGLIGNERLMSKCQAAFAVWNTQIVSWCNGSSWVDPSTAPGWIEGLSSGGGNDMRVAIDSALSAFPSATDIFTMCDGDTSPFDNDSWREYLRGKENYRFHFVALGDGASDELAEMASVRDTSHFWSSSDA